MSTEKFLNVAGLNLYDSLLKAVVGGALEIDGRTVSLKSVDGAVVLATVDIPESKYSLADGNTDGLLAAADYIKIHGVSDGANKVTASTEEGYILVDGVKVKVYTPPAVTALTSGLYKITVNSSGYVTAGEAVTKADITALGLPDSDTTYKPATASTDGLITAADFTKLQGIAAGAEVNALESVSVNGEALTVTGKGVNIDLTPYALKADVSEAVEAIKDADIDALFNEE
jgi:hypothetical protein